MNTVPNVRDSDTGAVDLQEVRPVEVAELGRDEAVHEPADEDDLGRVADPEAEARSRGSGSPSAGRAAGTRGRRRRTPRAAAAGSPSGSGPAARSSLNPGRARANRTSRMIGRTSETIVRGWRSRRPSDSWSAVTSDRRSAAARRSSPLRRVGLEAPPRRRAAPLVAAASLVAAAGARSPSAPLVRRPVPPARSRPTDTGRSPARADAAIPAGPLDDLRDRRARART